MALVSIDHVSHSFGPTRVLDDVSLTLAPDSYTVLLGPSGSGKTTLLSILGGFLAPERGRVMIRGEDCTSVAPAKPSSRAALSASSPVTSASVRSSTWKGRSNTFSAAP